MLVAWRADVSAKDRRLRCRRLDGPDGGVGVRKETYYLKTYVT